MESGTVFHIALLKKTSNARRKRLIKHQQNSKKPLQPAPDDNFVLSGWSFEEEAFKREAKRPKKGPAAKRENSIEDFIELNTVFTQLSNQTRPIRTCDPKVEKRHHQSTKQVNSSKNTFKLYREMEANNGVLETNIPQRKLFSDCTNKETVLNLNKLRTNEVKNIQLSFDRNVNLPIKFSDRINSEKTKIAPKCNKLNISYTGQSSYTPQNPTIIYLKKGGCQTSEGSRRNRVSSTSKENSYRKESFSNFIEFSNRRSTKKYNRF